MPDGKGAFPAPERSHAPPKARRGCRRKAHSTGTRGPFPLQRPKLRSMPPFSAAAQMIIHLLQKPAREVSRLWTPQEARRRPFPWEEEAGRQAWVSSPCFRRWMNRPPPRERAPFSPFRGWLPSRAPAMPRGEAHPAPISRYPMWATVGPCKHALHVELSLGRQVAPVIRESTPSIRRASERCGRRTPGKAGKEDGPEKGAERGLYHHSGQDHADAGGCGGMGVGKPEMEREHAHLQPKPCDDASAAKARAPRGMAPTAPESTARFSVYRYLRTEGRSPTGERGHRLFRGQRYLNPASRASRVMAGSRQERRRRQPVSRRTRRD